MGLTDRAGAVLGVAPRGGIAASLSSSRIGSVARSLGLCVREGESGEGDLEYGGEIDRACLGYRLL